MCSLSFENVNKFRILSLVKFVFVRFEDQIRIQGAF